MKLDDKVTELLDELRRQAYDVGFYTRAGEGRHAADARRHCVATVQQLAEHLATRQVPPSDADPVAKRLREMLADYRDQSDQLVINLSTGLGEAICGPQRIRCTETAKALLDYVHQLLHPTVTAGGLAKLLHDFREHAEEAGATAGSDFATEAEQTNAKARADAAEDALLRYFAERLRHERLRALRALEPLPLFVGKSRSNALQQAADAIRNLPEEL